MYLEPVLNYKKGFATSFTKKGCTSDEGKESSSMIWKQVVLGGFSNNQQNPGTHMSFSI